MRPLGALGRLWRSLGRLTPIVLRDLRRKARTRNSTGLLIALHVVTVLAAMLPFILAENARGPGVVVAFWWPAGLLVCLVVPGVAVMETRSERASGMLELVLVSGLRPRRVLWGKWLAGMAYAALALSSLLPYAVVRYFLGGFDLSVEVEVLAILGLVAAWMLALALALSVWQRISVAGVCVGLAALGYFVVFQATLAYVMHSPAIPGAGERHVLAPLMLALALTATVVLGESAVAILTPSAERRPWVSRALALVTAATATAIARLSTVKPEDRKSLFLWAAVMPLAVAIASLTEQRSPRAADLPRPLAWSILTRAVFGAGWEAGVVFCLLVVALLAPAGLEGTGPVALGAPGILLMPLPAAWALTRRLRAISFAAYMSLQAVFALPAALYALGLSTGTSWMQTLGGWLVGGIPLSFLLIGGPAHLERWTDATAVTYGAVSLAATFAAAVGAYVSARRRARA